MSTMTTIGGPEFTTSITAVVVATPTRVPRPRCAALNKVLSKSGCMTMITVLIPIAIGIAVLKIGRGVVIVVDVGAERPAEVVGGEQVGPVVPDNGGSGGDGVEGPLQARACRPLLGAAAAGAHGGAGAVGGGGGGEQGGAVGFVG